MLNKEALNQIKKGLKHGSIAQIAKSLKVSRTTVYLVLNGELENSRVLNACIDEAERVKKEREELANRVNKLSA